ncbi:hypothetical protein ACSZMQ_14150 [Aeromonas rivipollensis]
MAVVADELAHNSLIEIQLVFTSQVPAIIPSEINQFIVFIVIFVAYIDLGQIKDNLSRAG